ncbi:MAG: DUF4330 family protein [Clostridiales bacterium]|jgi:hypothetical protein|nr:DUF4330 family protein [Clostridiales bacterium]
MQERKRKPNIIDFVILLAVLAILAAVGYQVVIYPGGQETVRIRYVLEVPQIQTEFCSKAAPENPVFSYNDKREIGIVTATSTAPAYFKGTDKEGNPIYTEMEDFNILYVTIEADAVQTDTGYIVGGHSIQAGMSLAVQFPELYCEAQCISVNVIE